MQQSEALQNALERFVFGAWGRVTKVNEGRNKSTKRPSQ